MRRLLLCLLLSLPPLSSHGQEIYPTSLPAGSELARRLESHVIRLAAPELQGREPGTDGNRAAARYIEESFKAQELRPLASLVGFRQEISRDLGDNLVGTRPAVAPAAEAPFILVGAHYDHLGNGYLGADDNASGVATLIEVARMLPELRHHSLLFVAFNAEEQPYIRTPMMGSQYFVDHLPSEIGRTGAIKVAIIMDMVGGVHWEPLRQVVFAAGAEKAPILYRRLQEVVQRQQGAMKGKASGVRGEDAEPKHTLSVEGRDKKTGNSSPNPLRLTPDASRPSADANGNAMQSVTVVPLGIHLVEQLPVIGQIAFSDYDAFRNAGVPFLFLSSGRTPRYHTTRDLPDTLHYERMAAIVQFLVRLLPHIDADAAPYAVEPERIVLADEIAALRPLLKLAADPETEIPDTSFLSRWKLRRDRDWLNELKPASAGADEITRLERISIRMQCLLVDFSGCFLF